MKVVMLSGKLSGGGAERVCCVLANEFAKKHDVSVLRGDSSEQNTFPLSEDVEIKEVAFNYKNMGLASKFKEYISRILKVRNEIKKGGYDFVLGIKEDSAVRAAISSLFINTKVVACEHNHYFALDSKIKRIIRNVVYLAFVDKIVILTNDDYKNYPLFLRKKISVINNPLGLDGYNHPMYKNKGDKVNILSVGRLTKQKGYFRSLDLVESLINSGETRFRLTIVGEGELKTKLTSEIEQRNLSEFVFIEPYTNDISKYYLDNDIYLMTSLWEGLPMVLGEAMSFGLAPIAFDCPTGPSVFIKDGVSGRLISDGDLDKIQLALSEYIESSINGELTVVRQSAKEHSRRFSTDHIIAKWGEIFEEARV